MRRSTLGSRPVVLNQSRPKPRNLGPLGGQHFGMKIASELRGLAVSSELLHKPGRGILGGAGKRAEPREEDARASHDIGLNPARTLEGSKFREVRG